MEQTTPPPTKPVMDVSRPKSAVPTSPQPTAATTTTLASAHNPTPAVTPMTPPAPISPTHLQLTVHKAPADEENPLSVGAPTAKQKQDSSAPEQSSEEAPVHVTLPVRTGPHAPIGVIVLTVIAMVILSVVAIMIYLNSQK